MARRDIWAHAALLALISILLPLNATWAVEVILVPLLLIVPGVVLLRALRVPGEAVASFPAYVPAASLVVLLGSGLAVDLLGRLAGLAAPLRPVPLLIGFDLVCIALLWVSRKASAATAIPWSRLSRSARLSWPLILPVASAAGALRLNSGHRNTLALIAVAACVVVIAATFLLAHRLDKRLLSVILYAVGLGMMWSFSLRGSLVYGSDIATEYYDMHQTVTTGVWNVTHVGDAYGAMLAVTVLPALLHFLSGVPALLVFKVVYPVIGALFPVAVFGLALRVLSRRWAFLAAVFIVIQGPFSQQLTALARQQIALVLFAALLMVILDDQIPRQGRWTLASLFGMAMVVSHYSTTYVALLLIGSVFGLQWIVSWFRATPRVTGAVALALGMTFVAALTWYGPLTQSAAGLSQLLHTLTSQGLNPVPGPHGKKLVSSILHSNPLGHGRARAYARYIYTYDSVHRPYIVPLPQAGLPKYALHNVHINWPANKYRFYPQFSQDALIAQQVVTVLAAIGALLMILRRKSSVMMRSIGMIAIGAVALLIMLNVSTALALAYNETRALLQGSAVLGIAFAYTLDWIAGQRMWRQASVIAIASISLAGMFVNNSWLAATVFGGGGASNLSNNGIDVQHFVMNAPEIAAARWLGEARSPDQFTYADKYAVLRLITATGPGNGLFNDVTPMTISEHAWVYASQLNVLDRQANAFFNGKNFTYAFPFRYLNANYDLVYVNGSSKVFYR